MTSQTLVTSQTLQTLYSLSSVASSQGLLHLWNLFLCLMFNVVFSENFVKISSSRKFTVPQKGRPRRIEQLTRVAM